MLVKNGGNLICFQYLSCCFFMILYLRRGFHRSGSNQPKEIIFTSQFAAQKSAYIHNNPFEAGRAEKAGEYIYSSAGDYYIKASGLIKIEFLL